MNLWLLLCCDFWGPLELYSKSKMAENLDSWPLVMSKNSESWAGLKLDTCPVSMAHTLMFRYAESQIDFSKIPSMSSIWYENKP